MNTKKNVVDVSSFLLFEATGDSDESGYTKWVDPTMVDHDDADQFDIASVVMDEDDAESCSWECLSDALPVHDHEMISGGDHVEGNVHHLEDGFKEFCGEEEDYDEEEEGEEVKPVYNQKWGGHSKLIDHQKSCVSVDSTREFELLNEMEKNRIFWETCLAS